MKKLWTTTVPGKDPMADSIFHYYQVSCMVPSAPLGFVGHRPCGFTALFLTGTTQISPRLPQVHPGGGAAARCTHLQGQV